MADGSRTICRNCKVIPAECLVTYHRPLVMDVEIKICKTKKSNNGELRIRWWNLTT